MASSRGVGTSGPDCDTSHSLAGRRLAARPPGTPLHPLPAPV